MGTVAAVQCADAAAAPHVRDLAQRTFQSLDNDLSAWNPASTLCAVNAAAGAPRPVAVSHDFAAVLAGTDPQLDRAIAEIKKLQVEKRA